MSLDNELLDELRTAAREFSQIRWVEQSEIERIVDRIRDSFLDRNRRAARLWEALADGDHEYLPYGEGDGIAIIERRVGTCQDAILVVTDDEPPPWVALRGPVAKLGALLRDVRYVEFSIASPNADWVVFDTHDNRLVFAGALAGSFSQSRPAVTPRHRGHPHQASERVSEYDELERGIRFLIGESLGSQLTSEESSEIAGFADAAEYGLALETLVDIVVQERKKISVAAFRAICALAESMSIVGSVVTPRLKEQVEEDTRE